MLLTNVDNKTLEWSSSNDSWVSANQNGKITAVKSGITATITAETANGKKNTVIVDGVRKAIEYG